MTPETHEVLMPKLGESVTEGTITSWLKAVGDQVQIDDPLVEISTDKIDSEIPSPFTGTLLEILVPSGETVAVDTPLAHIGRESADGASAEESTEESTAEPTRADYPTFAPVDTAASHGAAAGVPIAVAAPRPDDGGRSMRSPIVRRLAVEHNIDLTVVPGSGEGGRIMREDVEAAIARNAEAAGRAPIAAPVAERDERVEMSRLRVLIAENMTRSLRTSAHVWTSVEVDLERIEQIRLLHKERFRAEEGASLTYLPFIARATCDALRRFPAVNSSIDAETQTMTLHHYVNLGIAVDLEEMGLIVPVVKAADSLNIRGLAKGIAAKALAARTRSLGADDIRGSTFTITNPGPLGDYASAPIINQPNVAILSTNQVARRPTAVGEVVAIHHMTILGLSYDHRALDGVTASKFLASIRDSLQDRDWESEVQ